MSTMVLCPLPKMQFFGDNGLPLAGGYLYTDEPGTPGIPKDTYTDSSGTALNTNPIILDSAGRASIWIPPDDSGYYYMELWTGAREDAGSSLVLSQDNVGPVKTEVEIPAGSVGTTALADEAVTTDKIEDEAVTAVKIKNKTITNVKIADSTIQSGKLSTDKLAWNGSGQISLGTDTPVSGAAVTIVGKTYYDGLTGATPNNAIGEIYHNSSDSADSGLRIAHSASAVVDASIDVGGDATHGEKSIRFTTNSLLAAELDSNSNLKFNSGYGSAAIAYGCRAWVQFDGSGVIKGSGNVDNVVRDATGRFTITLKNPMPDSNYAVNVTASFPYTSNLINTGGLINSSSLTASTVKVHFWYMTDGGGSGYTDPDIVCVTVFR